MNEKILYSYALAKTIYEQKEDYIDTFYPFVLKVLPPNRGYFNLSSIQKKIKDNYGLSIPEHSLVAIITRAKRKGLVKIAGQDICLNDQGVKYIDGLESEDRVSHRIRSLMKDIKEYLDDPKLSLEEIYEIILFFINKNIESIMDFFNPEESDSLNIPTTEKQKYSNKIVNYFELAEKEKPEFWKTLQDIVYGAVISISAISEDIAEVNKRFQSIQIFFDSNFFFSLFDLHTPEVDKPAKELYELLKIHKFKLKIFDFTINEIIAVLSNYRKEQHMYIPGIKVNSIYSTITNLGWTSIDVEEFILNIEQKIWDLGIEIESTNINLKTYNPKEEHMRAILECKPLLPYQNKRIRYHDLAAIERIKAIRRTYKRRIEHSKAIFLTSDLRLVKCNLICMGHKEEKTICEVISDRVLTNILWLKNPTILKDIPMKSIISIHSKEIFIDNRIWRRFYEVASKLKENGEVLNTDLATLFYNRYIESVLSKLDDSNIDKITPKFLLEEIEIAKKDIDDNIYHKLDRQKKIFEDKLSKKDLEKEDLLQRKVTEIKEKVHMDSKKISKNLVNIFSYVIGISIAVIFFKYVAPFFLKRYAKLQPHLTLANTFLSILAFLGIRFSFNKFKDRMKDRLFKRIYKGKLTSLELDKDN